MERAERAAESRGFRFFRQERISCAHPLEHGSVESLSVSVQSVAFMGVSAAQRVDRRASSGARQGALDIGPMGADPHRRGGGDELLRGSAGSHSAQRAQAVSRHHHRRCDAVSRIAQRRYRFRGGRRQQFARAGRRTAASAALPAGGAPGVRHARHCLGTRCAHPAVRVGRVRRLRFGRIARLHQSVRNRLAESPGPTRHAVGTGRAGRLRYRWRYVYGHQGWRCPGASSLREFRCNGGTLYPRGRR